MTASTPSNPSDQTRAFADFAFGSQTHVADASRPLAWLSPEELDIDLSDPVQRRFGDYELIERIGQGGMGVVYRARQHGLERDVAIKLLAAGPWASEEFVARFRREARSAARMQHPNIVEIYEFGHREGLNYFSMRLIEGLSLAQRLAKNGPMPAKDAAKLLRTLAEAMDYAHRLGVLHLDLKPANVLIGQNGEPLIADFGLARRIDAGQEGGSEEISGTPSYMAPEQALLESHPLTASTDIYGLGTVLYETLTGRPPFAAVSAQATLERVITEAPAAPRTLRKDVPPDLEAICLKCLEKRPDARYASARELADDLGRFIEGWNVSVRMPGTLERLRRWARREPKIVRMVAIDFAAALLGGAILAYMYIDATWARRDAVAQRDLAHKALLVSEQRAERMKQLSGLIASMFPPGAEPKTLDAQAMAAVGWLRTNLPGNDTAQAELLSSLTTALLAGGNRPAAEALLEQIYKQLGEDHMRRMADVLSKSEEPKRWLLAGMIGQSLPSPDDVRIGDAQLRRAVDAMPEDRWALLVAATYCDQHCAVPDAAVRLSRLDPDNLFAWAAQAGTTADMSAYSESYAKQGPSIYRTRLRALIPQAARATRWDDGAGRIASDMVHAYKSSGVPVPTAMTLPTHAFGKGSDQDQDYAAFISARNSPVIRVAMLGKFCDPTRNNANRSDLEDPALRADCIRIGRTLADSNGMPIVVRIGEVMLRRLEKGTPVEREMIERRRQYAWLQEHDFGNDIHVPGETPDLFIDENVKYGELGYALRHFDRIGIPRNPPPGWQPKDPTALLLPEDRQPMESVKQ